MTHKFHVRVTGQDSLLGTWSNRPRAIRSRRLEKFHATLQCENAYSNWGEQDAGNWKIDGNQLCLMAPPDIQFWRSPVLSGENCWKIVRWKFGFAALDSKGNEDWTMTLEAHPKHSSREELYAALKEIYVPPVAEAAHDDKLVTERRKRLEDWRQREVRPPPTRGMKIG